MQAGEEFATYVQRTALDGRDYLLTVTLNQREGKWYVDLADQNGDPILYGIKLVVGWPLLRTVTDERRPPGELFVVQLGSDDPGFRRQVSVDPDIDAFGATHAFLYLDADGLAELEAAA
jgi:hypothetical protein